MTTLDFTNLRVLVTGGAGLIGSHITDHLLRERVAEVIVLDNFSRGRREHLESAAATGRLTIVEGDIRDRAVVSDVMQGIDVVFHQAAIRITQCAEEPDLAVDVLVNGTLNVLQAARQAHVRKIVAASSASVYGMADRFPTNEQHHPYNNRTLYGAAKLFDEGLLRAFYEQYDLDYVALRYFNVYGPRMDTHGAYTEVFIRWMAAIAAGQSPIVFGDGTQTMDFIHVSDVARANLLAARAPVTDAVYNVATGLEVSLTELAQQLLRTMRSSAEVEYQAPRRVNPVPRRLADTWRAEQEIGFRAIVPFEDGIAQLVEWWQHQLVGQS
jgi:nucleoside-diphosphate-sugar epimerase